jgi:signal transduction histidine kinase
MRGRAGVWRAEVRRWRERPVRETERLLAVALTIVIVGGIVVALLGPVHAVEPGIRAALAAAIALLLVSAYLRYVKLRRRQTYVEICAERERLACDLHDGLAQDLACIAAQGQRLDCQLDPDHPLMVASRHALARVRGLIADLTASTAPTTEAALCLVADQLGHRFGLQVDVRIEGDSTSGLDDRRGLAERDELIRSAREAIVNAALRGGVRHVDLVLSRAGALLVRVSDDSPGIADRSDPAELLLV